MCVCVCVCVKIRLYRFLFFSKELGWGDAEALAIAAVLQSGAATQLATLDLRRNSIGDAGETSISVYLYLYIDLVAEGKPAFRALFAKYLWGYACVAFKIKLDRVNPNPAPRPSLQPSICVETASETQMSRKGGFTVRLTLTPT